MRTNKVGLLQVLVLAFFFMEIVSTVGAPTIAQTLSVPATYPPSDAWLNPGMVAPHVANTAANSGISVDEAGRIHFESIQAAESYFDHWLSEDERLMSTKGLAAQALRVAYGDSWTDRNPTRDDVEYKKTLKKSLFWLAVPNVSVGTVNVFGSSITPTAQAPKPAPIPGFFLLPGTFTTSLQTTYILSWNIGTNMLQRKVTTEAVNAQLASEYKMRNDVLQVLSASYVARRVAQIQFRDSLLELMKTDPKDTDRIKDLRKAIDSARVELVKASLQIDVITDGAASKAYTDYCAFIPLSR